MQIRTMMLEDYEEVYHLWMSTPGMGLNNIDDSKTGISKFLLRNPNTCFVAMDEDELVGVILSGHDGRRGYIYHTAVALHKRNQSIGQELVQNVIMAMDKEGINKIALVAFADNKIGNSFWEKQGFIERTDLSYRNKNIKELCKIKT